MKHVPITPDILAKFRYAPDAPSGLVRVSTGQPTGERDRRGYWRARVYFHDGTRRGGSTKYQVNRIVWALHHGDPGPLVVDHIDGDRGNNNLENLQAITGAENTSRRTGKGYTWHKGKWLAQISKGGKRHHIGLFDTEEEARAAYVKEKAVEVEGLSVSLSRPPHPIHDSTVGLELQAGKFCSFSCPTGIIPRRGQAHCGGFVLGALARNLPVAWEVAKRGG